LRITQRYKGQYHAVNSSEKLLQTAACFSRKSQTLHKSVTIKINGHEFALGISGSGKKCRVGGKIGTKKNRESFQNVSNAMKACQNPAEKLHLLNLMISVNPHSAKKELAKNGDDLGAFKGFFTQDGKPSDVLSTLSKFEEHLAAQGVDTAALEENIASLYENLKLGQLIHNAHGGERKRLHFNRSSFAKSPERAKVLEEIATHNKGAYWAGGWKDENISMRNTTLFKNSPPLPSNITYDAVNSRTYSNADKTMEAGIRYDRDPIDNKTPKKMSISEGLELGLITPEKARELQSQNPPLTDFTPMYVVFRPTQSVADMKADIENIRNGVPQNVRDADALAQAIISNVEPGVVPIFTGHSMGGMLAHAVGAKHNCASIAFNPLGLGEGVRKFIDEGAGNRCGQANDAAHAECHSSFVMRGDWVSDEKGSLVAKAVVKKPYIGQRYVMEDKSGVTGSNQRHNAYLKNIEKYSEGSK
jgi:hypothetical protein